MGFLGFPHQTHQIHNPTTPKRSRGQVLTKTFTTLLDNNRTLRDGVVFEVNSCKTADARSLRQPVSAFASKTTLSCNVLLLFHSVVNVQVTTCPPERFGVVGLCI